MCLFLIFLYIIIYMDKNITLENLQQFKDLLDQHVIINLTWAQLKALRDNSQLIPGQQYRITDFVTTTSQADTSSAGHQFDIIVIANANNMLNESARAIQHEGDTYFADNKLEAWELRYCLDNDNARFAWADTTNGKGIVYYMKDEFHNEVPYDFKNIIYEYKKTLTAGPWGPSNYTYMRNSSLDVGGYYGWTAVDSVSYGAPTNLYTNTESPSADSQLFSDTSGTTLSKTIKSVLLSEFTSYTFNLVVSSANTDASLQGYAKVCHANAIGIYVLNGVQALNKTVFRLSGDYQGKVNCHSNVISSQNYDNLFAGSYFYSNTVCSDFCNNTIGSDFQYNTIGSNFYYNTVGNNFSHNTVGSAFQQNTVGSHFSSNTISFGFYSNTVGSNFFNNTIGSDFRYNTVGNSFNYNTIGSYVTNNTIGSYVANNTIGSYVIDNTIGLSASENVYVRWCKFDDGVQYVSLTSDDTSASSSNQIQNVHIHLGVKGSSSSNRLTISVPDRNLSYSIDYYASNSQSFFI